MNQEELKARTKKFALRTIRLVRKLPSNREGWTIGDQLFRCSTSVASNYRATCRARSRAEFISRIGIVIEEADECLFWFEIIVEAGLIDQKLMENIQSEGNELLSIFTASSKTAKKNKEHGRK